MIYICVYVHCMWTRTHNARGCGYAHTLCRPYHPPLTLPPPPPLQNKNTTTGAMAPATLAHHPRPFRLSPLRLRRRRSLQRLVGVPTASAAAATGRQPPCLERLGVCQRPLPAARPARRPGMWLGGLVGQFVLRVCEAKIILWGGAPHSDRHTAIKTDQARVSLSQTKPNQTKRTNKQTNKQTGWT